MIAYLLPGIRKHAAKFDCTIFAVSMTNWGLDVILRKENKTAKVRIFDTWWRNDHYSKILEAVTTACKEIE